MSIFGPDYDDSFTISDDLDMDGNRIRDLGSPRDSTDAVNKRYINRRIEYKTKELEGKYKTLESNVNKILSEQRRLIDRRVAGELHMNEHRITVLLSLKTIKTPLQNIM